MVTKESRNRDMVEDAEVEAEGAGPGVGKPVHLEMAGAAAGYLTVGFLMIYRQIWLALRHPYPTGRQ